MLEYLIGTVLKKMRDQLLLNGQRLSPKEDKKVEEEILERNIKLRAIDLLNGQSINKQFKELKVGTT